MNRFLLEFVVKFLPLLLQSGDELLAFLLWHQHLLTISLVLFLDLHLADKVIFVLDLTLDLSHILWYLSVGLLLEEVLVLAGWQFWCSKNVLNCICYNEVFVGDETVDWLLVSLWNGLLFEVWIALDFVNLFFVDQNWLSSVFLSEHCSIWLKSTLWSSHSASVGDRRMMSSFKVEFTGQVGALWLGSSLETEGTCSWSKVTWVLTLIALWLLWDVLLLRDEVVYALVKIYHR